MSSTSSKEPAMLWGNKLVQLAKTGKTRRSLFPSRLTVKLDSAPRERPSIVKDSPPVDPVVAVEDFPQQDLVFPLDPFSLLPFNLQL